MKRIFLFSLLFFMSIKLFSASKKLLPDTQVFKIVSSAKAPIILQQNQNNDVLIPSLIAGFAAITSLLNIFITSLNSKRSRFSSAITSARYSDAVKLRAASVNYITYKVALLKGIPKSKKDNIDIELKCLEAHNYLTMALIPREGDRIKDKILEHLIELDKCTDLQVFQDTQGEFLYYYQEEMLKQWYKTLDEAMGKHDRAGRRKHKYANAHREILFQSPQVLLKRNLRWMPLFGTKKNQA